MQTEAGADRGFLAMGGVVERMAVRDEFRHLPCVGGGHPVAWERQRRTARVRRAAVRRYVPRSFQTGDPDVPFASIADPQPCVSGIQADVHRCQFHRAAIFTTPVVIGVQGNMNTLLVKPVVSAEPRLRVVHMDDSGGHASLALHGLERAQAAAPACGVHLGIIRDDSGFPCNGIRHRQCGQCDVDGQKGGEWRFRSHRRNQLPDG